MTTPESTSRSSTTTAPVAPPTGGDSPPSGVSIRDTFETAHWLQLLIVVTTCLLLLVAVGVVVRLLEAIGHTILLFSLGGLLAYAFDPIVERIRKRADGKHLPRWLGVTLFFVLLLGLLLVVGALLSAETAYQVKTLIRDHTKLEARGREKLADLDGWLAGHGVHVSLEQYIDHPPPNVKSWGQAVVQHVLGTVEHFARSAVEVVIILLITLYFLIYSQEMREGLNKSLPAHLRPYAHQWQEDVNRILGGFVRGQSLLALIMGAAAGAGCALLGVRYWLLIGVFVVFASLIPVFGPYIGAVPALIASALTPGGHFLNPIVRAVLVLLLFVVINEAGSKILYPRLVGAALGLHEVLVLFVLFAGLEVGGILGVLFAAPLTALAAVTLVQLYRLWQGLPPVSLAKAARTGGQEAEAHGTP